MTMYWCGARPVWMVLCLCIVQLHAQQSYTTIYLDSELGADSVDCLNQSSAMPCRTLSYVFSSTNASSVHLKVYPGKYSYGQEGISLSVSGSGQPFSNLMIEKVPEEIGNVVFHCSFFSDREFVDLGINGSDNVTIIGVTVEQCGSRGAGIYIDSVEYVAIRDCTFRNNINAGLTLYNCRNIEINNCSFIDNSGSRQDRLANITSFNYRTYSTAGLTLIFNHTSDVLASIYDCYFYNNSANINPININDPRPSTFSLVGHGGAMLVRFANLTNNSHVVISRCVFNKNFAVYSGGSLYVPFIQDAANNTLDIEDSWFESSISKTAGGAIAFDFFDIKEGQQISISNTTFKGNSALFGGGGLNIALQDSIIPLPAQIPISLLRNVTFDGNRSPTGGSAIGLVSNARVGQPSFTVAIVDCLFVRNSATNQSTIFTFRFPLVLKGSNKLCENIGGGITVTQTQMDVRGQLLFQNNRATEGAGIVMEGSSIMNLHENVNVTFTGNKVDTVGGAILIRNPVLDYERGSVIFNSMCFIQYDVDNDSSKVLVPNDWKGVTVLFDGNYATEAGAVIYSSDIAVCTFITVNCSQESGEQINTTVYERSIFRQKPFDLRNGTNQVSKQHELEQEVATDPVELRVKPLRTRASPGDVYYFTIEAYDQSGNFRGALWTNENDQLLNGGAIQYDGLSEGREEKFINLFLSGYENSYCENISQFSPEVLSDSQIDIEFFVIQALTGEIANETHIKVDITCCHPGYYYDVDEETCKFNSDYPHFLRNDEDNRYVYLQPGFYAGFYNDTQLGEQYFTTALLPSVFQRCRTDGSRRGCKYEYDNPDNQCVDNRTGYMCGQCPEGMGVDLTLRKCKNCNAGDAVGLVIIFILVVVCSVLVLIFNIGVPNDLIGVLFYAQVVGFVYQQGARKSSWDFHLSRLFGFSVYLPICPFTSLPALWSTVFGLFPSILATATVIIYIVCARFIDKLSQRSAFRGIWLIFLFVYKYTADTAFNIVKCVQIEGDAVDKRHFAQLVFFYDGTVPCFTGLHLIPAIPSIVLIILVLTGPAFITLISFKRFKATQPFTDVITEGIETKYRWWAGFDVFRRLLFIVAVTIFDFAKPEYAQLLLCLVTVVVLGVLCATKPYKKGYINVIEAAIILDLLLIAVNFLSVEQHSKTQSDVTILIILLLLPFLYAVGNIGVRIIAILWIKFVPVSPMKLMSMLSSKINVARKGRFIFTQQPSVDIKETDGDFFDSAERVESDIVTVDYSKFRDDIFDTL